MPRALISVSDKTGVADFGRELQARGYEILSTGGTAQSLRAAGVTVTNVSDVTGVPEMMDGRVKTLHPAVHAGILARRDHEGDMRDVERLAIGLVDVVAVNLYPFVETAADPDVPLDALVEEIDIGGPSLVRAAAKNFMHVLVLVSPDHYGRAIVELDRPEGPSLAFRFDLARAAFAHTAAYDAAITSAFGSIHCDRESGRERLLRTEEPAFPGMWHLALSKRQDLRYGENPHQQAAWYARESVSPLRSLHVIQGKPLSFNNLLDLDAAWRLVREFDEPAAAVIKHMNPCGAATGDGIVEAYLRAREADRLAAYGGIVGLNRPIDEAVATAIAETFIEVVVAPELTPGGREVLAHKPNLRVVLHGRPDEAAAGGGPVRQRELRTILGAVLAQEEDRVSEAHEPWPPHAADSSTIHVVTRRAPSPAEWQGLRFAWRVCAHVKSNAVIFTTATETVAIGAGQTSRVDAVKVAGIKAPEAARLQGTVVASDAFFPFRDGLDAIAAAGATAVVQPGGSVRDDEVIAAADEHGLAMVFTGRRHFRH